MANIYRAVNDRVKRLHDEGHINDSTLDYLLINSDARAGKFYLLPKTHKKGCPGRPVISGCNTPTEKLSEFVDAQLKPLVPRIASYVQDSNDMLRKLKDMERLPENAILVTIDVVGLYPHIPHQREEQGIPTEDIVDLASIVLKNNNFGFDEKHFVQKSGTAIGTKMAPSYANLFMDDLERKIISASTLKPYMWLRFIDDVFMVWTHGEERLREFLDFINGFHNSI